MASFLGDICNGIGKLKETQTRGGNIDVAKLISEEPSAENDTITRDYFFQAGIDEWYNQLDEHTFRSSFVSITEEEAKIIISNWDNVTGGNAETFDMPIGLHSLVSRIDEAITKNFPASEKVFIKLSTRSPKDSKTILRHAAAAFNARWELEGERQLETSSSVDNRRMVSLAEEVVKASAVTCGLEAVTILLDSERVAEDLRYAFLPSAEGQVKMPLSLVLREWHSGIRPQYEFRGFVWNRQLTCMGQYWHSLYLPELEELREQIEIDCRALVEEIQDSLPVPQAMLDLAWIGPGEVILVEVNPLMEGLGSFRGSTGLFDYYEDSQVLSGQLPFEFRIRQQEAPRDELLGHMSPAWRKILFGF